MKKEAVNEVMALVAAERAGAVFCMCLHVCVEEGQSSLKISCLSFTQDQTQPKCWVESCSHLSQRRSLSHHPQWKGKKDNNLLAMRKTWLYPQMETGDGVLGSGHTGKCGDGLRFQSFSPPCDQALSLVGYPSQQCSASHNQLTLGLSRFPHNLTSP